MAMTPVTGTPETGLRRDGGIGRRTLLTAVGMAAGTAAVAAPLVVAGTAAAAETPAEKVKARYRETDHVKAYYRTNRY